MASSRGAIAILVLLSSACSGEPGQADASAKVTASASAAQSLAPAASSAPARPPRSLAKVPDVEISDGAITLDGIPAGDAKVVADQPVRLPELFKELKAIREEWKIQKPAVPFRGETRLRVDPETTYLVLTSLIHTAAYAGYPRIELQMKGTDQPAYPIEVQIPTPPDQPQPLPATTLHVADDLTLTWKKADKVLADAKVPKLEALEAAVCKEWTQRGLHKQAADYKMDKAQIDVASARPFKDIVPLLAALSKCTRDLDSGGRVKKVPAFEVSFPGVEPRAFLAGSKEK